MKPIIVATCLIALATLANARSYRDDVGQAACNNDFHYMATHRAFAGAFGMRPMSHGEDNEPAPNDEHAKQIAASICQQWQEAQAAKVEKEAAAQKVRDEYVPHYEPTLDVEWHVTIHDVHADVLVLKTWYTYPTPNMRVENNWPVSSRVNVPEGSVFSVPRGTFDPHSIEMKVRLWGLSGVFVSPNDRSISPPNATIPTAAADPRPMECETDYGASRILDKSLIRCRYASDQEWMSNDDRNPHE